MMRAPIPHLLLVLLLAVVAGAQSLEATVGSSQMMGSSGLQTTYKWRGVSGWVGIGYMNGMQIGGYLETRLPDHSKLALGDQMLSGYLDTDAWDSHAFTVRGASILRQSDSESMQVFFGLLTQETMQPYLRFSGTGDVPLRRSMVSALIYRRKLSDTVQFHSLNLVGSKLTALNSLGWTPSKQWKFAVAAGVGSGKGYFSGSGDFHREDLGLRFSYTAADPSFHRQEGWFSSSEPLGFNGTVQWMPRRSLKLTYRHEHLATFLSYPHERSTVSTSDSLAVYEAFRGFRMGASASSTRTVTLPGSTVTGIVSVSRKIVPRWTAFASVVRMQSPTFRQQAFTATNEFRINQRLALRQNYTRSNGQNNFSFGAEWRSNLVSFSIDQQLYVSPLAPALGGKAMFQAWTFTVRFRGPRGTRANLETYISPDGRTQWGGYLSGLRYRAVGPGARSTEPAFSKYVIRGTVVDQNGQGVWGIALQIGSEVVISDSHGEFFTRVRDTKALPVMVLQDASLQPMRWSAVSAPASAQGVEENLAVFPVRVVVRLGASQVATK